MATTTIRVDEALKARIAATAERAGKTTHAFMRDAIEQSVEQAEIDDAFHKLAEARWAGILTTGGTVGWDDAKNWLSARSRGEHPPKPAARKPGQPAE